MLLCIYDTKHLPQDAGSQQSPYSAFYQLAIHLTIAMPEISTEVIPKHSISFNPLPPSPSAYD